MVKSTAAASDSVSIVLVGCGYIAQAEHLPGWEQEPLGRLLAVVDRDRSTAERVGQEYRVPHFADLGSALRSTGADAVHVCTPASTHEEVITEALAAGCHVLAEKPLTDDIVAAGRLRELARESRLTLMVGAPRLYDPYLEWVTAALDRGDMGFVSSIETVWRMSQPADYRRLTSNPRHPAVTSRPGTRAWLRERLLEESIHHLGVLGRWTRGPLRPRSVIVTERAFHIALMSPHEVIVTHSNVSPAGHGETFTVYAEGGRIEAMAWSPHFPALGGTLTVERSRSGETTHPHISRSNPYWRQNREFVEVVLGRASPRRSLESAVEDIALIEAIVQFADSQPPGEHTNDGLLLAGQADSTFAQVGRD